MGQDVVDDLKQRARILHRAAAAGDAEALRRAGVAESELRRRHCLAAIARELGFSGWQHASDVLRGKPVDDFGTLLYPYGGSAHSNIWSASYDEARQIREEHGGWLLAYKKHFFITDRHFIETLGLDPDDPDWERIGRDWARPRDVEARGRLYAKLIASR